MQSSNGQSSKDLIPKDLDSLVSCIDNLDSLDQWDDTKKTRIEGLRIEGSEVKYHIEDETLKKIVVYDYGETGKKITVYYLVLEKPFLIHELIFTYNRPIYWDEELMNENGDNETFNINKTKKREVKSYFAGEHLIHQEFSPERSFNLNDDDMKAEQERLLGEYKFLIENKDEFEYSK